ncbi:hypothetical protein [Halobacteriovorax sp. HLS]|uniref:hypothetical protein n=1 Tax=Halobacteriovorax sp. HLS TaxID=2234000 RepID=UPI000FDB864A|nr:hypothetical protein [Halobacteriovorax sp. HLS]
MNRFNKLNSIIFSILLVLSSCVGEGGVSKKSRFSVNNSTDSVTSGGSGSGSDGATALPGGGSGIGEGENSTIGTQVELMHLVDPFDGTYKKKLTLPKNFTGLLYLSGLNISSLSDKIVYARFVFGKDYEPVTIQGTIGRAPGITPQTDVEVLILDMASHPFQNIRLSYDLFDYNDYSGEGRVGGLDEIVTDPRDAGLYCRGLNLIDDKTFDSGLLNSSCDAANEVCKYTYARIEDTGMYYDTATSTLPFYPSEPQVALGSNDYQTDPFSTHIKRCLPDSMTASMVEQTLNTTFTSGLAAGSKLDTNGGICGDVAGESCYTFYGPYRNIDSSSWQITGSAIYSDVSATVAPTGLFKKSFLGTAGYESLMFPRFGKLDLNAGIEYIGSTTPFDGTSFSPAFLSIAGETDYVEGCNIRATNYDSNTQEGISSCNVTARVELFYKDASNSEVIITKSNNIVLQLIRPSLTDYKGEEVLYTSLKSCSSSQTCGGSECCFNERCWSKELVSQCLEDVPIVGNKGVGVSCQTDYECSSLCCNQTTGTCAVHVNTDQDQVFCSKAPGQACVAKEWCRQENVPNCFIVKTGSSSTGQPTCALRCYNVPTFGDCTNGVCTPPPAPPVPTFDPANPDCSTAIDPPTFN